MAVNIPLELVMKIFTLATHRREEAASWICISKRTYILFERLLYNKVVLKDEDHAFRFLECYRLRQTHIDPPPATTTMFLGDDITYTTLVEILSLCKDITNLSIASVDDDFIRDLTNLHHVLEPPPPHGALFKPQIIADSLFHGRCFGLFDMNAFPKLTHLALLFVVYNPGVDVPGVVKRLLQHATLQVLVFRVDGHSECATFLEPHGIVDRRIIIGPSRTFVWDDFGHGDMLLWELADDRVNMPAPNHTCLKIDSGIIRGFLLDFLNAMWTNEALQLKNYGLFVLSVSNNSLKFVAVINLVRMEKSKLFFCVSMGSLLSSRQLRALELRVGQPHKEVMFWLNRYSMNDPRLVLLHTRLGQTSQLGQGDMLVGSGRGKITISTTKGRFDTKSCSQAIPGKQLRRRKDDVEMESTYIGQKKSRARVHREDSFQSMTPARTKNCFSLRMNARYHRSHQANDGETHCE
ncbi:hypothetical protein DFJ58DRAFT_849170 [Suillus subalutaceus]|uniref:uncharacterized protein n=1 Tax=Suillus subalutaceus TaxID=48586 RepID=UPI001B86930D|nr:uncharacterized protein DFJ58DRAFT_849170 [Suillus subalutaceus]KAG1828198.1 hypothetical protein DFJ58DRAFT_849170 [Suillus subalutaceus]